MADRNANIVISLRNTADPEVRRLAASFGVLIQQTKTAGATQEQAEKQALAHAQALARLAVASGQAAQGERILTAALTQVDRESAAATRAETQLVGIQNRLAPSAQAARTNVSGLGQAFSQLTTLAGGLGIGLGVQQIISGGVAAGQAALELRETKNALRAVAGDTQTYTKILQEARQQQLLFGGSLQENIDGLQGLAIVSRSSGANLSTLIDLQKRLATLDPAQGARGALTALNEALSGNVTSLSRRFEIPKDQLKVLADTSLPVADRLQAIDTFLNKVGITSAAVSGKVDQDALAFRRLGQEIGDLTTKEGGNLASFFSGAATGLSRLLGVVNENPQAIAELKALFSGRRTIDQSDIDQETRGVAARRASAALGGTRGQAIVAQRLGGAQELLAVQQALQAVELKGEDAQRAGEELARQFLAGALGADEFRTKLDGLANGISLTAQGSIYQSQAMIQAGNVASTFLDDMARLRGEIQKSADASVQDAAQKGLQAKATQLAQIQANQAVDAFLALNPNITESGIAAELAAGRIDRQTAAMAALRLETDATTTALFRQQQAQVFAAAGGGARRPGRELQEGAGIGGAAKAFADNMTKGSDAAQTFLSEQKRIADSQTALDLARAKTSAQRIAILQRELAQTTDVADRNRILAQIESERNSGAKAHTSELGKQLSLEERIRDSKEAQLKAALDAAEAAIRDRQDRRKEEQEARAAQRILASGRSSQTFKDAAADALALIAVHQQQRQLDINNKLATAGGAIVNGRVLQSVPGGGVVGAPLGPAQKAGGGATAAPSAVGGAAAAGTPIQFVVDGRVIAQIIVPLVIADLRQGNRQSGSAGGGVTR